MLPVASREKIALISAAIMQGYILAVSLEIVQTWLFSSGSAPWSAALRTCPTNSIIPRCFFEMCADNASRFCSIPFLPLKETPFLIAKSAKKDSNAFVTISRDGNHQISEIKEISETDAQSLMLKNNPIGEDYTSQE